ncbi:MAG: hypothetical protein NTW86_24360 [Candidatus Sumerlaeota bacterium]|nr:hypothetical protein [Candidatus Sumerlaeota bacterium]
MKKKLALLCILAALFLSYAPAASAHEYDRDDSDMWLRYVAYAIHPVGIAIEYGVLRPIHWVVSQKNLDILFGHKRTEDVSYCYFEWQ